MIISLIEGGQNMGYKVRYNDERVPKKGGYRNGKVI